MYNDFNKLLDSFKPASAGSVIYGPGDRARRKKKRKQKKADRCAKRGKNRYKNIKGCQRKVEN